MVYSATLIKRPRKMHHCQGFQCGALLHGEHLRVFGAGEYGENPSALRLCKECGLKWREPKITALLRAQPRPARNSTRERTLPERLADHYRAVVLWQDGVNHPEIATTLGVSEADIRLDLAHFSDGDDTIQQVRKMAHATGWPGDYRNHYVAGEVDPLWERLIEWGFAEKGAPRSWIPGVTYRVTDEGKKVLRELGAEVPDA